MKSYSQYAEDETFVRLLQTQMGNCTGRLLEIGAWHPTTFSNSRALIELGWSAVLVDFSPGAVKDLAKEYVNNDKVMVVQTAITPVDSGLRRFDITDEGVSTSEPEIKEKWAKVGGFYGALWVPVLSLDTFLSMMPGPGFDFVSIDAEGLSTELAIGLVRDCHRRPRVMCVEHDDKIVELMQVMQQQRYTAPWVNGTNIILETGFLQ